MDLDQTQAIVLEDYQDETDEEQDNDQKKPASYLKVFCQKGFPETKFPLYEGDNVIGREQGKCNIYIPIKALSKQHACIEIRGDTHLIYDKGSRNKTKWGKLYLSPDVRYGLRDGDEICMADVRCVYQLHAQENEDQYDSGSETGSESMFQTATMATIPDMHDSEGRRKFLEAAKDEVNDEDERSNASSDLLQPTQLYGAELGEKARKGRLDEATTLMFAEDSDLSDMETSTIQRKKKNVTIAETPAMTRAAHADVPSTVVFSESDCEDDRPTEAQTLVFDEEKDDLENKETLLAAPTQPYGLDSDVEEKGDSEDKEMLLAAPTQAYAVDSDVEEKDDSENKEALLAAPTQAYALDSDVEEKDDVENKETLLAAPTQAYALDSDVEEDNLENKEKLLAAPTQAYALDSDVEDDDDRDKSNSSLLGAPTQMYGADDDGPEEGDTTADGLTLAYDVTFDEGADTSSSLPTKKTRSTKDNCIDMADALAPTQAYGLEPETNSEVRNSEHQQLPKKVRELECSDTSTQSMEGTEDILSAKADMDFFAAPTMACDLEDVGTDATEKLGDKETDPEEKITGGEGSESTQAFETFPVEKSLAEKGSESTQVFETVPIGQESPGKPAKDTSPVKSPANKSMEQTMILPSGESTETVVMDDEGVESESGKTKMKVCPQEDATMLMNDGTTQVIEEGDCCDDGLTSTEKGKHDVTIEEDATQVFVEEEEVDVNSVKADQKAALSSEPDAVSDEVVPDSCESEDNTPSAIPLPTRTTPPARTPLKPALASPKKNKSPLPKKVAFVGVSQSSSESSQETKPNSAEIESQAPSENKSVKVPEMSEVEAIDTKPKQVGRRGRGGKSAPKPAMPRRGRKTRKGTDAGVHTEESFVEVVHEPAVSEDSGTNIEPAPPKRRGKRGKRASNVTEEVETEQQVPGASTAEVQPSQNEGQAPGASTAEVQPSQNEEQAPETGSSQVQRAQSEEQAPVSNNHNEESESIAKDSWEDDDFIGSKKQKPVTRRKAEQAKSTHKSRRSTRVTSDVNSTTLTESSGNTGETPVMNDEDGDEDFHPPDRRGRGKKPCGSLVSAKTDVKGDQNEQTASTGKHAGMSSETEVFTAPEASKGRRGQSKLSESEDENVPDPQVRTSGRRARGVKVEEGTEDTGAGEEDNEPGTQVKTSGGRGRRTKLEASGTDDTGAGKDDSVRSSQVKTAGRRGRAVKVEEVSENGGVEVNEKVPDPHARSSGRRGRGAKTKAQGSKEAGSEEELVIETKTMTRRGRKGWPQDANVDSKAEVSRGKRGRGKGSTERDEETDVLTKEATTVKTGRPGRPSTQPAEPTQYAQPTESAQNTHPTQFGRSRRSRKSEATLKSEVPADDDTVEKEEESPAERTTTSRRGHKRATEAESTSMGPPAQPPPDSSRSKQKLGSTEGSDTSSPGGSLGESETPSRKGRRSTVKSTPTKAKHQKLSPSSSLTSSPDDLGGDIASPRTSRRKSMTFKPKVAFTGVVDEHGQKITKDLGGGLVSSVYDCTHLVTDKVRRTVKFLCCLARGLPIVLPQWLDRCKDAGVFIDPNPYIIEDKTSEKQYKFCLRSSIQKASEASLLSGFKIHVTKSVRPDPPQMRDIIQCSGAEYLAKMPSKPGDQVVVISCEEDKGVCQPAVEAGITVVSSEFLFTGILRQEVLMDELFQEKGQPKKRSSTQLPGGGMTTKKRRK